MNNDVNSDVLRRAFVLLYTEEALPALIRAYEALNAAMASAYSEGYQDAEDVNHGSECDCAELDEDQLQFKWDDGYLEGVEDARSDPAEADRYIAFLVQQDLEGVDFFEDTVGRTNAQVEGCVNGEEVYDVTNVSDSGDTSPCEMNPDDGWAHSWDPVRK